MKTTLEGKLVARFNSIDNPMSCEAWLDSYLLFDLLAEQLGVKTDLKEDMYSFGRVTITVEVGDG